MLGYSLRSFGQYDRAIQFHQEALEIAQQSEDSVCAIANLNHLSRTYLGQKKYEDAIDASQRALILSRQGGDRLGQANALANLGYSQVFQAREMAAVESDVYETAIRYLEQGLELSGKLVDLPGGTFTYRQTEALCASSLGIAYVVLEKPQEALKNLAKGLEAAQFAGDLYLQGLNYAYIAQTYWSLTILGKAVMTGCLGMYLLEQIGSHDWRQPAGLLTILKGQSGADAFEQILQQQRAEIISVIGVDGYDYLPELLEKYQRSL
jgi:tetratricopeptide (TPR) repeat protein